MKKFFIAVLGATVFAGAALAGSHGAVSFDQHIKPLMKQQCFMCHGPYSPDMDRFDGAKAKYAAMLVGPRMYSYEELVDFVSGGDAGALMRRLDDGTNTSDGKPGNMYEYLGDTDKERAENLKLFKRWAGHWTLKRERELTDEDRKLFKVLESR